MRSLLTRRLLFRLLWAIFIIQSCLSVLNVGATYQRALTVTFHGMLHNYLKGCLDDIVVKSRDVSKHVNDLEKVFFRCREYNLNQLKCAFILDRASQLTCFCR